MRLLSVTVGVTAREICKVNFATMPFGAIWSGPVRYLLNVHFQVNSPTLRHEHLSGHGQVQLEPQLPGDR